MPEDGLNEFEDMLNDFGWIVFVDDSGRPMLIHEQGRMSLIEDEDLHRRVVNRMLYLGHRVTHVFPTFPPMKIEYPDGEAPPQPRRRRRGKRP